MQISKMITKGRICFLLKWPLSPVTQEHHFRDTFKLVFPEFPLDSLRSPLRIAFRNPALQGSSPKAQLRLLSTIHTPTFSVL